MHRVLLARTRCALVAIASLLIACATGLGSWLLGYPFRRRQQ